MDRRGVRIWVCAGGGWTVDSAENSAEVLADARLYRGRQAGQSEGPELKQNPVLPTTTTRRRFPPLSRLGRRTALAGLSTVVSAYYRLAAPDAAPTDPPQYNEVVQGPAGGRCGFQSSKCLCR
jgi:hypothetical protein